MAVRGYTRKTRNHGWLMRAIYVRCLRPTLLKGDQRMHAEDAESQLADAYDGGAVPASVAAEGRSAERGEDAELAWLTAAGQTIGTTAA